MNLTPDAVAELTAVGQRYNIAVQSNDMDATKESSLLLYDMARGHRRRPQGQSAAGRRGRDQRAARRPRRWRAAARGDDRRHDPPGAGGRHHRAERDDRLDRRPSGARSSVAGRSCAPTPRWCLRRSTSSCASTRPIAALRAPRSRDVTHPRAHHPGGRADRSRLRLGQPRRGRVRGPESFRLDRPNMKDSLAFGRGTHIVRRRGARAAGAGGRARGAARGRARLRARRRAAADPLSRDRRAQPSPIAFEAAA